MIQLLERQRGWSARTPGPVPESTPAEGYSATYAYVRESNMHEDRRDDGGSVGGGGRQRDEEGEAEGIGRHVEESKPLKRDSPATACGDASAPHEC